MMEEWNDGKEGMLRVAVYSAIEMRDLNPMDTTNPTNTINSKNPRNAFSNP
jgi:hypothetical protein